MGDDRAQLRNFPGQEGRSARRGTVLESRPSAGMGARHCNGMTGLRTTDGSVGLGVRKTRWGGRSTAEVSAHRRLSTLAAPQPGERRSTGFLHEQPADERRSRVPTVIDQVSREPVQPGVAPSLPAVRQREDASIRWQRTTVPRSSLLRATERQSQDGVFSRRAGRLGAGPNFIAPCWPIDGGWFGASTARREMSTQTRREPAAPARRAGSPGRAR